MPLIIVAPMAGPRLLSRQPAVAGTFYPADPVQCRALAEKYTESRATVGAANRIDWIGGVVPHAGWVCSGAIAGQTLSALRDRSSSGAIDLVVIFGAIHTPIPIQAAALDSFGRWDLPGGDSCEVQRELRQQLLEGRELFCMDDRFHLHEHAIEVELPLIRSVWPTAAILPIEVPAIDQAVEIGRHTANAVKQSGRRAVFLASSDLTHYGPAYGFAPAGVGPAGLQWAKCNDRRLIDRILQMQDVTIVTEARANANACGAGAIVAMLAACREFGASRAELLCHASSFDTLAAAGFAQTPDNAVGYASIIVG